MDDGIMVDVDDIYRASDVWMSYHHYDTITEARRDFDAYLGGPALPSVMAVAGWWMLTNEQEHRMRLLLGPHAKTVIKAYYAKKD